MSKSSKMRPEIDPNCNVKRKYKRNKHEEEIDALLSGKGNKKKQRNKNKEKKKKTTLIPSFYYETINADNVSSEYIDYDSYYDFPINSMAPQYTKYPYFYKYSYYEKYRYYQETQTVQLYKNLISQKHLMYFTKHQRIMLINGYIQCYMKKKSNFQASSFRYPDVLNLIELYYNNSIFIWNLIIQNADYVLPEIISSPCSWPFSFRLEVFLTSKFSRTRNRNQQQAKDTFIDLELNFLCWEGSWPSFVKIYYELYCNEIEKINFWKGVKKYRYEEHYNRRSKDKLIIPRRYIKTKEFMDILDKKDVNIKLSIKFLCVEWFGDNDYFQDIKMIQNIKFNWFISNNHCILDNFRNKRESILFSKNFDDDNWCLYCKQIQIPTNKKKIKFCIALMLIKLPWYFNYIQIQLIIKCNGKDNKKTLTKNIWPGFESALQIPFKYDILREASQLNITVKFKIIKVFDINDKQVDTKHFVDWN